ncbi:hypothetical protein EVAR_72124_1 [Eumeta japonica]|uniref:Uncharacterized protein n=1 Tax=Eumeta variegata TaxID=151549 RepID=A0A4C1SR93_EUMVA|nr:hypothetical protein EVAR_72124_1 [Eumeta japonica]
MNDVTTLRLISLLEPLMHTKVLLIDIVATSFNAENRFYKYLTLMKPESHLMSNLLLLTILSDNYRYFLNVAFENNDIEMVQNFRQQKLWQAKDKNKEHHHNWPIHLDKSVTDVLQLHVKNQQKQQYQQHKIKANTISSIENSSPSSSSSPSLPAMPSSTATTTTTTSLAFKWRPLLILGSKSI